MKKSFSVIVVAALLLGGCSKSELANQEPSGALIKARSAFSGVTGEATRAPYIGDISSDNKLDARVLTSRADGNYTTTHANGKMIFEGGNAAVGYDASGLTGTPSFESSDDQDPYYLVGLYPFNGWGSYSTTASFDIDGKTDVMVAAQQSTTYSATTPPTLTFKHLLTKLEVSVKAKEGASKLKWGKINAIELTAIDDVTLNNNIEVTLATGVGAFKGGVSDFPFYSIGSDGAYTEATFVNAGIELNTTSAKVAYSLIAPFENVDNTTVLKFNIVTENASSGVVAQVTLPQAGNTQGRAYSITFVFDAVANPIQGSATVVAWESIGGTKEVVVE